LSPGEKGHAIKRTMTKNDLNEFELRDKKLKKTMEERGTALRPRIVDNYINNVVLT
jgi:hypothetical protein